MGAERTKSRFILITFNFFTVSEILKPIDGEGDAIPAIQDQAELIKEGPVPVMSSEKSNTVQEPAVKFENKTSMANGEHQNNNIEDSKNTSVDSKDPSVIVKKEKKPNFEEDDPFAALDWKDGIATLPGNYICFIYN